MSRDLVQARDASDTKRAASPAAGGASIADRPDRSCQDPFACQLRLEPLGEVVADPRSGRHLLHRCLLDAPDGSEPLEQRLLTPGPDARDVVELAAQRLLATHITVIGDGEPMRLVPDALHEV